jgi:hypothetical protein
MYPHYQTAKARRPDRIDTILEWRYLASHKLAADEHYERAIAEAAQRHLLVADGLTTGWRPVIDRTRRYLGAVLVAMGTRLQGMSLTAQAVAAPIGSGAPSRNC